MNEIRPTTNGIFEIPQNAIESYGGYLSVGNGNYYKIDYWSLAPPLIRFIVVTVKKIPWYKKILLTILRRFA